MTKTKKFEYEWILSALAAFYSEFEWEVVYVKSWQDALREVPRGAFEIHKNLPFENIDNLIFDIGGFMAVGWNLKAAKRFKLVLRENDTCFTVYVGCVDQKQRQEV